MATLRMTTRPADVLRNCPEEKIRDPVDATKRLGIYLEDTFGEKVAAGLGVWP